MGSGKRIVVIGAGPSGLCATRHCIANGFDVVVYEQTTNIGGTWVYTDLTGLDDYGLPIHSSMYHDLKTNLPIETMGFPDYQFPKNGESFVGREQVLDFFKSYAKHFGVTEKVKFEHHVIRVKPIGDDNWEVIIKDLKHNSYITEYFDYVFVCNGHYFKEFFPNFPGRQTFKGKQIHAHQYRRPDPFTGENVLIVGGGPSGKDIVYSIASKANRVDISTHRDMSKHVLPANVSVKTDVKELKTAAVIFEDESEETYDTILYCTGYQYSFPFLSSDTGLCVRDGFYVHPLYKHCININYPTMAIIGEQICAYTLMYDMQVRFCFKFWKNEKELPSREEMLADESEQMKKQWNKSEDPRKAHLLGVDQNDYFRQLAEAGDLVNYDEVYFKIYDDCTDLRIEYPNTYREFNYKIIDSHTFHREHVIH